MTLGWRQWLQAEIENAASELDPQQLQQCGGDATVAALRARFHRQTEQEQLAKDAKEKAAKAKKDAEERVRVPETDMYD